MNWITARLMAELAIRTGLIVLRLTEMTVACPHLRLIAERSVLVQLEEAISALWEHENAVHVCGLSRLRQHLWLPL